MACNRCAIFWASANNDGSAPAALNMDVTFTAETMLWPLPRRVTCLARQTGRKGRSSSHPNADSHRPGVDAPAFLEKDQEMGNPHECDECRSLVEAVILGTVQLWTIG